MYPIRTYLPRQRTEAKRPPRFDRTAYSAESPSVLSTKAQEQAKKSNDKSRQRPDEAPIRELSASAFLRIRNPLRDNLSKIPCFRFPNLRPSDGRIVFARKVGATQRIRTRAHRKKTGIFSADRFPAYSIPRSRFSQAQAERSVSSIDRSAFHPSSRFAYEVSAQIFSMSPVRRPTILCGTRTPVARSNSETSSSTERPRPVPILKYS